MSKKNRERLEEMMSRKVDFRRLGKPGECSDLHEKLARDLAREYQRQEDPDYVSISWANQERAQAYFNQHGFVETLNHMLVIQKENDG